MRAPKRARRSEELLAYFGQDPAQFQVLLS